MATMETTETILASSPYLTGLPAEIINLLAEHSTVTHVDAGKYIFHEGEVAKHLYIIKHGRVALEQFAPNLKAITIQTLSEGELLGWSWLIPPHYWRFDAHAIESTELIVCDGNHLRQKCDEDPKIGYEIIKRIAYLLGQRLYATRIQLMDVYGKHN
jgi:CRP/FNR family transcriptional regulator, cyclic AMP receptor protein